MALDIKCIWTKFLHSEKGNKLNCTMALDIQYNKPRVSSISNIPSGLSTLKLIFLLTWTGLTISAIFKELRTLILSLLLL